MKYLSTAALGLFAMSGAAMACPAAGQMGPAYSYSGDQLYSPQTLSTLAGGASQLRNCNLNYAGYANSAPNYTFNLSGMDPYYLVAEVEGDCDTTLLVNTANGAWMFNDDSAGNLQPRLELRGAQNLNGQVSVWVGTYGGNYCNANLTLESWYDQAAGQQPGAPVPQPQPPAPNPVPQPMPQPAGACPSWQQPGQTVHVSGQQLYSPQRYNVQAGGMNDIRSCNLNGSRGYANVVPNYSFILSGMEGYGRLEIEVEASCDTTLLVNTPDTTWYFDDDSNGNLQPLINIPASTSLNGRMDLWVGTYGPSGCPATVELETWHGAAGGGSTPQPQPQPQPQPTGMCPTWSNPGQTIYATGSQLYSPQRYQVQAGGSYDIRSCNLDGSRGYANPMPHYSFILSEMESYGRLEIEVDASCDTTLLVNTPDTTWYFDDDSGGNLQPEINIPASTSLNGRMDLWVGTYGASSCPATVELETWHGAAGGGSTPQPMPQPAGACPSWQQPGQTVHVSGQQLYSPQRYNVQAGGMNDIRSCNLNGSRGYANVVPNYSFILSGMEGYGRLEIEVEASCDTTLLVNTPDTTWYFDDDSNGNLQPLVNVPSSTSLNGRMDLWVGTYGPSGCPATVELETWYN